MLACVLQRRGHLLTQSRLRKSQLRNSILGKFNFGFWDGSSLTRRDVHFRSASDIEYLLFGY
jgi:hypothetical protein